jgi:hypothetical protein
MCITISDCCHKKRHYFKTIACHTLVLLSEIGGEKPVDTRVLSKDELRLIYTLEKMKGFSPDPVQGALRRKTRLS